MFGVSDIAIEDMIDVEYENAMKAYPLFHSTHEGFAVIQEEAEEVAEELDNCMSHIANMWLAIKSDTTPSALAFSNKLYRDSVALIHEAIQLGAMAIKFKESVNNGCGDIKA